MSEKVIAFAGSLRTGSYNKMLCKAAVKYFAEMNVDAEFIDLKDFPLPLYDGDLEAADFPQVALALKEKLKVATGFVIATPEYNSSYSSALKNAIDWISRDGQGGGDLGAFTGKKALLLAASPGALGGIRALTPLRLLLSNIGVWVAPEQLAVPKAMKVFADNGEIISEQVATQLQSAIQKFIEQ